VLLLALGACTGACGDATGTTSATCAQPTQARPLGSGEPGQYAASIGAVPQSPDVDTALQETIHGLDADLFSNIRVGAPPQSALGSSALWLHARVAPAIVPHDLSGAWEAELAAGAVADRCAGDNISLHGVMTGVSVHTAGPHGDDGGGFGDARAGQIFGAQGSGESDQAIVDRVEGVLTAYGLTPRQVRVLHPLGPAVQVVATVDDVHALDGKLNDLTTALEGRYGDQLYEGLYLQIDQTDGTPLLRSYGSGRSAGGGVWFAPGLDSLWGINHG
jgi:hypothetical protein